MSNKSFKEYINWLNLYGYEDRSVIIDSDSVLIFFKKGDICLDHYCKKIKGIRTIYSTNSIGVGNKKCPYCGKIIPVSFLKLLELKRIK